MLSQLTNRNFYLMLGIDAVFFVLALLVSYLIHFDFVLPADHWQNFWATLPWAISVKLVLFYAFGLEKEAIRRASLPDLGGREHWGTDPARDAAQPGAWL
ncbi:MAG: hypothetical protein U5L00_01585 [Desulfovermiculus sp.]|nr:hypothetical protein [Desulfovermiculus sp.]